jgi:hypothetical protein
MHCRCVCVCGGGGADTGQGKDILCVGLCSPPIGSPDGEEQSNKRLNQPHPMQQFLHNTRRVNGEVRFIDPVPGDLGSLHLTGE